MGVPSVAQAQVLDARLRSDAASLAKEFREADPFPHVVIPDFFAPDVAQRLHDDFPGFEDRYAKGEMGKRGRKAARRNVREISDTFREVDDFIQTSEFLDLMSEVSGIPDLMYDPEYHGGGTHENLNGACLYTHVDFNYHPKGWHRRLNLIVYLSSEWEEEWGGCLELRANPWEPEEDRVKVVPTKFNHAVLFETSEHSWHGFPTIKLPDDRQHLSRRSFAIYLYTKDRPADQTAASHSTIYIPFGMPQDLAPDAPLTREHYQLLSSRFNEYRSMLKLQYDRQLRQSEEFRDAYRMDLQGYAIQTRAPTGRWADSWVSSDFNTEFTVTRPVSGITLEVVLPPKMEDDQELEISIGSRSFNEVVPAGGTGILELPVDIDAGDTVELAIKASTTWSPENADTRQLAYRLVRAELEHYDT